MSSYFHKKVFLITGASSGIGKALVHELAVQGASLVLLARRQDLLEGLKKEIEGRFHETKVVIQVGDVTREGDVGKAVAQAVAYFGKVDGVIANAGFGVTGTLEELSIDDYRRQLETNVFGVLRTLKEALPALKKSKGHAVIIGSVSGYLGIADISAYVMSKFALTGLAQCLHFELAPDNIKTTLICPGFVTSEIRRVDNQGTWHPESQDVVPPWLCLPAEKAAKDILHAVARGRREAIITGHGKFMVWMMRHFPNITHHLIRKFKVRGRPPVGKKT